MHYYFTKDGILNFSNDLDEDELCIEVPVLNEIQNFLVDRFFFSYGIAKSAENEIQDLQKWSQKNSIPCIGKMCCEMRCI